MNSELRTAAIRWLGATMVAGGMMAGGVALAPLKNLSNAMGLASDAPRYPSVSSPRDPLLVGVQKFVQGVDVIYRIGK